MTEWFIIVNGKQVGPLNEQQLVAKGLNPESYVWHAGMSQWAHAAEVPELANYFECNTQQNLQQGVPPFCGAEQGNCNPNDYRNPGYNGYNQYRQPYNPAYNDKSKVAAGVLAMLLGALGIQYFYLGKIGAGFITILLTVVTCGLWEVITFVQGILMLTMSDEEFYYKYVNTAKTFPLF